MSVSIKIESNSPIADIAEHVYASNKSFFEGCCGDSSVVLFVGNERTELLFTDNKCKFKPFYIDFCQGKFLGRLKRAGKNSEAVARATIANAEYPVVFDATAGLGRDSFIIQICGATVFMFERNPLVWILLKDALLRAKADEVFMQTFPSGIPTLMPLGSVIDNLKKENLSQPDVVYYDPMFPKSTKTALVKKEMQVFHTIVGTDEDIQMNLDELLKLTKSRLVLKRPAGSEVLKALNIDRSGYVDGKACRFDIYSMKKCAINKYY